MADARREPRHVIPNARHEHGDIEENFVWRAAALMLAVLVVCAVTVIWLYPRSLSDVTLKSPLPVYPAPRLQPDPPADMRAYREQQRQQLDGTGWVDRAQGVVHLPIEESMQRVAHDGIPGWPAPAPAPTTAPAPAPAPAPTGAHP